MSSTREALSWDDVYRMASDRLSAKREARWIMEEAAGEQLGRTTGPLPEKVRLRVEQMVRRRLEGEPLQYVLGSWPFRRVDLMLDRRVLIPRPETEQVVEVALGEMDRMAKGRDRIRVVDLGTGSGAIALSFAQERTNVDVWAVDASPDALAVARANLAGLAGFAATRVRIVEGDWWNGLPEELRGRVDLAVSNPPYVSSAEMAELSPEVRDWEPSQALEAGPLGTEALERILSGAPDWLAAQATVVAEIAPHQAEAVCEMATRLGFAQAEVRADLAGRPRALVARR